MHGRLERSYRNTVYCASRLVQEGGTLSGRYCSNRWCLVCARVKTARAINRYSGVLQTWSHRWFVTLTAPNVATGLTQELKRYLADVVAIQRAMKRTHGIPLVAIRKLECTYNAERDDYHPHFHFLVRDEAAARLLLRLWLERRPDSSARAQDVRRADDGDVRDMFKYFTKLVTRTRAIASAGASVRVAQAEKLDVIFSAMRGLRVFQPVGFILPTDLDEENDVGEEGHTSAPDRTRSRAGDFPVAAFWEWSQESTDWFNLETGEALAEYEPSSGMRSLVEGIGTATERGAALTNNSPSFPLAGVLPDLLFQDQRPTR
ncbi:MAG TPA: protein rep [Gemmatimonadaceae bacterium]|nr:protein rep [Gemmatimonadaceae bacterium]